MNTKSKLELLETVSLSFITFSAGVGVGEQTRYATQISIFCSLAFIVCTVFVLKLRPQIFQEATAEKMDALRFRGLYPSKGEGSDDDVKRLKAAGEKGLAFRLYLELHAAPLKDAWRDFKAL